MMSGPLQFHFGRLLVVAGIVLVVLGLAVIAGGRFAFWGLGRLPGDIAYKGRNVRFYFPILSCVILSAVATAVLWIISYFTRK